MLCICSAGSRTCAQETRIGPIPQDRARPTTSAFVIDPSAKTRVTSLFESFAADLARENASPAPNVEVSNSLAWLCFSNLARVRPSWPTKTVKPPSGTAWECPNPSDAQLAEAWYGAVWLGDRPTMERDVDKALIDPVGIQKQKFCARTTIGDQEGWVYSPGFSIAYNRLNVTIMADAGQTETLKAYEVSAFVRWNRDGWLLLTSWSAVCRRDPSLEKATWERARDGAIALARKFDAALRGNGPPGTEWRSTRFEGGIAQLVVPTPVANQYRYYVPQGATVEVILRTKGQAQEGPFTEVRLGKEYIELGDGKDAFATQTGVVKRRKVSVTQGEGTKSDATDDTFTMRVAPDAPVGPLTFVLRSADGKEQVYQDVLVVCRPLVVLLVIDGLRQQALHDVLVNSPASAPNLTKLVGGLAMRSAEARGMKWTQFDHGLAMTEATTVFPPVTFAGNAAIFAGAEMADLKMAGNEWFDRTLPEPYKFAFTGDNLGLTGIGDSHASFTAGRANERLLASGVPTIYADAAQKHGVESAVHHSMYYGDGNKAAAWKPYTWGIDEVAYYLSPFTEMSDGSMATKAAETMSTTVLTPGDRSTSSLRRSPNLGLVTLYWAGLDHLSHIWSQSPVTSEPKTVPERQKKYLGDAFDNQLGRFLDSLNDAEYKNACFLLTADHGHTDMGPHDELHHFGTTRTQPRLGKLHDLLFEFGYVPQGTYRVEEGDRQFPRGGGRYHSLTAVVGLDGGMAHVYLRKLKEGAKLAPRIKGPAFAEAALLAEADNFETWPTPPSLRQVLQVAEWYRISLMNPRATQDGTPEAAYASSVDMILVRDAEHGGFAAPYQVYQAKDKLVPVLDYLRSSDGVAWMKREGWNADDRDAVFLAARIAAATGPMSGDLIVVPRYPEFYCEYAPQYGDHGGFTAVDFKVPFLVARPGEKDAAALASAVLSAIAVKPGKDRPMNTDTKPVALTLLSVRAGKGGLLPAPSSRPVPEHDTTPVPPANPTTQPAPPTKPTTPNDPAKPRSGGDAQEAINAAASWSGLVLLFAAKPNDNVLRVERVVDGSLAAKAGIRPGDVVERLGDEPIRTTPAALIERFYATSGGTIVQMVLRRGSETVEVSVRKPK